ncbi:TorD/DmsD family molecular chaperone [Bradyrhizobium oligotrophicum]|uniref:TorD/DmsD family molecular chaperone n=1 Tax=Bradyrhizobium oligotrophicum TaxID=44255 RepID=UPI003EBF6513
MTLRSDSLQFADCLTELARLFGAPLEEVEVAALIANQRFDALHVLDCDPRHHPDLCGAISAVTSVGDAAAATSLLNAAFCRLFLGLGPSAATLPIESAHRGNGRLFQEPVSIMSDMLAAHGLCPSKNFTEPPDHLAIELSLLEQLIRLQASLVEVDERAAISTLCRRLAEWTPDFAAAVAANDPTGFYAALARILVRLLEDAVLDLAPVA